MAVHSHSARQVVGWAGIVLFIMPSAICFEARTSSRMEFSDVTGRMTYSGQPLNGMTLCLDSSPGVHCAYGSLDRDGSFRLINMTGNHAGAAPGRYYAHLYAHPHGPVLPPRYWDTRTSGLEIEIAPDWNDLTIDLH